MIYVFFAYLAALLYLVGLYYTTRVLDRRDHDFQQRTTTIEATFFLVMFIITLIAFTVIFVETYLKVIYVH